MNNYKTILAVVLGLSVASIASANEIYLTGSTAARAAVYSTMMNPGSVFQTAPTFTGFGAKGSGDTYMAFQGTLNNGNTATINCYWSGSEAGIGNVGTSGQTVTTFMADGQMNGSDNAGSPAAFQTAQVDLAMADNAQQFSPTGAGLPTLTGSEVGVVPFHWVRNPGVTPSGGTQIANVTDSEIIQALSGGAKLSVFTGNSADSSSYVYVAGRDTSSGTRVNAYGDTGFGIQTAPQQIVLSSGAMVKQTPPGGSRSVYIGNIGQSSGGTLAGTLGTSTASSADQVNGGTGFSVISYLGVSDDATAVAAGAVNLSYNGVAFSIAAIEEGNYTFWGNEYVYKNPGYTGESPDVGSVYSSMINTTTGVTANADNSSVIALTAMHCTRTGPNSDPTHN